jgi:hypothetical protein
MASNAPMMKAVVLADFDSAPELRRLPEPAER